MRCSGSKRPPILARRLDANNLEIKNNSVFYDLGCGDGRVLVAFAKKHPAVKMVGVDISFLPYFIAKWHIQVVRRPISRHESSEC